MRLVSALASCCISLVLVGAPATAPSGIVVSCTDPGGCTDVRAVAYAGSPVRGRDTCSAEWLGSAGEMTSAPEPWAAGGTCIGVVDPAHDFVQLTSHFTVGQPTVASINFRYLEATSVSDQRNWAAAAGGTVPEPSALVLYGRGLAGLAATRRSKQ